MSKLNLSVVSLISIASMTVHAGPLDAKSPANGAKVSSSFALTGACYIKGNSVMVYGPDMLNGGKTSCSDKGVFKYNVQLRPGTGTKEVKFKQTVNKAAPLYSSVSYVVGSTTTPTTVPSTTPTTVPTTPTTVPSSGGGTVYNATAKTLASILAQAPGGSKIYLAPESYGLVVISNRHWSPAITIYADGAMFGPATGSGTLGYAVNITRSSGIKIVGGTYADSSRGAVINMSQDITITNALLTRLITDGIDVALSQRVTISNSRCELFTPKPLDHPDCIQLWSRPEGITSDVLVENVEVNGDMQGISGFNHVRNGIDDGGFDRIIFRNNVVRNSFPNAIALVSARNSVVTGNDVAKLSSSAYKSNINISGGSNNKVCDNIIADIVDAPAEVPCK